MAILYICFQADGTPKHIHEQSSPLQSSAEMTSQCCVGSDEITSATLVEHEHVDAALDDCVASGTYSRADIERVKRDYNTRYAEDLLKNAVPMIGDIQNG